MAPYKLQELPPEREPFFPKEALVQADRIASDPKLATEFLKEAGILDRNGDLAEPYRADR
jgi:hypothetical protein